MFIADSSSGDVRVTHHPQNEYTMSYITRSSLQIFTLKQKNAKKYVKNMKGSFLSLLLTAAHGRGCVEKFETEILIPNHTPCYMQRREDLKIRKFALEYPVAQCQSQDIKLYSPKSCDWTGCKCHDQITGVVLRSTSYNELMLEPCDGEIGRTCRDARDKQLREDPFWYESRGVLTQCTGPNEEYWSEKQRHLCGCSCVNKYNGIITQTGPCWMECPQFNKTGTLINNRSSTRKPFTYFGNFRRLNVAGAKNDQADRRSKFNSAFFERNHFFLV